MWLLYSLMEHMLELTVKHPTFVSCFVAAGMLHMLLCPNAEARNGDLQLWGDLTAAAYRAQVHSHGNRGELTVLNVVLMTGRSCVEIEAAVGRLASDLHIAVS